MATIPPALKRTYRSSIAAAGITLLVAALSLSSGLALPGAGPVQHAALPRGTVHGPSGAQLWSEARASLTQGRGSTAAPHPGVTPNVGPLTWLNITNLTAQPPPGRDTYGMAYDAKDGYVVLYGGQLSNGSTSDTWIFQGGIWYYLNIASPPARQQMCMAYDSSDGYVVMFGGYYSKTGTQFNDTWKFTGGSWTNITATVGPKPRQACALADDPTDGSLLLFGGFSGVSFTDFRDTWTFKAGVWTQHTYNTTNEPPARYAPGMTYDNVSKSVVMFGGYSDAKFVNLNDSWNYSKFTWNHWGNAPKGMVPREFPSLVYDPYLGHTILVGGDNSFAPIAGTYELLAGGNWTAITMVSTPQKRAASNLVWDYSTGYGILFGGYSVNGVQLADTWSLGADLVASVILQPSSIDLGQTVTFRSAAVANNTTALTFNYFGLPNGCSNLNTSKLLCTPTINGSFPILVNVTDPPALGHKVTVNVTLPVKGPPLVTSFVIAPTAITNSQNFTSTALTTGGVGPLTFSYKGLPGGCSSRNLSVYNCRPSSGVWGKYNITVTATDLLGGHANRSAFLIVNNRTAILFNSTYTTIDLGSAAQFHTWVTGGTGVRSYAYTNLPQGCLTQNTGNLTCTPSGTGNYTNITVTVTDATGYTSTKVTQLVVNPAIIIVSFVVSPATIDLGQTAQFTTNATGGTGLLVYTYNNLPKGCAGTNFTFVTCAPVSSGTTTVEVQVTDQVGGAAFANTTLTVSPDPSISSFAPSRTRIDLGQSVNFTAVVTGGSGGFSYTYSGLPIGCTAVNASVVPCTPTQTGTASVHLTVRDTAGRTQTAVTQVQINALPQIRSFSVTPTVIDPGTAILFAVIVSGGTGPLTYAYVGLPSDCPTQNRSSIACSPNASGTYHVTVTVTDFVGQSSTGTTNLTINQTASTQNSSKGGSSIPVTDILLILVGVVVVAVIAGLLAMRRRGGSAATSGEEDGSDGGDSTAEAPDETIVEAEPLDIPQEEG